MRLLREKKIRSVVRPVKCLQQKKTTYVVVVSEEGRRTVPMPYWLTVAAAEDEELLENMKIIFGDQGKEIRVVEKDFKL